MLCQTKLERTVELVEARVRDNSTENALRDLLFLADHYTEKKQWDKANAATRHMVNVAEGKQSAFNVLPVDIELHQSRKRFLQKRRKQAFLYLLVFEALAFVVLFAGQLLPPDLLPNLRCALMPWSADAFVQRAEFKFDHGAFEAALADDQKALSISPHNRNALKATAWTAFNLGKFSLADQLLGRMDASLPDYWEVKAVIASAECNFLDAATNYKRAAQLSNKYIDWEESAHNFACAGDFPQALTSVNHALAVAKNKWNKAQGLRVKARILRRLGRSQDGMVAIDQSLKLDGLNKYANVVKSELLFDAGQYEAAAEYASHAILLDRTYVRAYKDRAAALSLINEQSLPDNARVGNLELGLEEY